MKIHREGKKIIFGTLTSLFVVVFLMLLMVEQWTWLHYLFVAILALFALAVTAFFRIPRRIFADSPSQIIAPADGHMPGVCADAQSEIRKAVFKVPVKK